VSTATRAVSDDAQVRAPKVQGTVVLAMGQTRVPGLTHGQGMAVGVSVAWTPRET
jgi:hypothetical protein